MCRYGLLFVFSIPRLVGRERVCAFGNGSSELCCLCKNKHRKKRGTSKKFIITIKHMRITDRGNEISSDSPPDRGRDTMMLVIVKRIMTSRTHGGLGAGTQRYFKCVWHLVSHMGCSSGEKRKSFVPKMYLLISYIVCLTTRTRREMRWITVV